METEWKMPSLNGIIHDVHGESSHLRSNRCPPSTSAQQEWFVATAGGNILSSCGKNCHHLEIQELLPLLVETARLKEEEFRDFVKCAMSNAPRVGCIDPGVIKHGVLEKGPLIM